MKSSLDIVTSPHSAFSIQVGPPSSSSPQVWNQSHSPYTDGQLNEPQTRLPLTPKRNRNNPTFPRHLSPVFALDLKVLCCLWGLLRTKYFPSTHSHVHIYIYIHSLGLPRPPPHWDSAGRANLPHNGGFWARPSNGLSSTEYHFLHTGPPWPRLRLLYFQIWLLRTGSC